MSPDSDQHADQPAAEDNQPITIERSAQLAQVALDLVRRSRRTLAMTSRQLDPVVYDQTEFVEAVRQLALRSQHSRIRVIVNDPKSVASRGHRLLELARQLPTFIEIRRFGESHESFNEAWLLADDVGYIRRSHADRYNGIAVLRDRRTTRELLRQFDELWQAALPDAELRRLSL